MGAFLDRKGYRLGIVTFVTMHSDGYTPVLHHRLYTDITR